MVVVGAGLTGMATAIELAQQGIRSVVLEDRGLIATRDGLFNVNPEFIDELARLDPSGGLVGELSRTSRSVRVNDIEGTRAEDVFGPLVADAPTGRGDMAGMLDSAQPGNTHGGRAWGKIGIGDLENAQRRLASSTYADLIEVRYHTKVAAATSMDGYAEASVIGPNGVRDAVRGAFLVNATARPLPGQPALELVGRPTRWIGARFPAQDDTRILRSRALDDAGVPRTTLVLEAPDRTWVWAQTGPDALERSPEVQLELVRQRAHTLGLPHPDPEPTSRATPLTVQLALTTEPASGRIINVGDANRTPYFSRGTGAAAGIVHDAPRAADAIAAAIRTGDHRTAFRAYTEHVRSANGQLTARNLAAIEEELAGVSGPY